MSTPGEGTKRGIDTPTGFGALVGTVLREVRTARSLSLRQVASRSSGRFKPSSVASYERGERSISLERLFALAEVYEVAPERIVAAIAHRLEVQREREAGREPATPEVTVVDTFGEPVGRAPV